MYLPFNLLVYRQKVNTFLTVALGTYLVSYAGDCGQGICMWGGRWQLVLFSHGDHSSGLQIVSS